MSQRIYSYTELYQFALKVFTSIGCSNEDASLASSVLLSADLRGIDSHGIARLVGYVRLWEVGRINAQPNIQIVHETPSTAVVDGDKGLGLIVAPRAMQIAMEKAKQVGTGWVSVKNSNHFGIAGYHAMMALTEDMIGMAMTNASALVAPTYAAEKMLDAFIRKAKLKHGRMHLTTRICVSVPPRASARGHRPGCTRRWPSRRR